MRSGLTNMAEKHHRIERYRYGLEAGSGFARISLWGPGGNVIGEIGFIDESRSVPNPKVASDLSHGVGFLPASRMAALIDMLRNEESVYLSLSDDAPGFFSVHTLGIHKSLKTTGG